MQGGEPLLGGGGDVLDLVGIAQDGSRNRLAVVDIEAGPVALVVGRAEASETGADAAAQAAALLDRVEGFRLRQRRPCQGEHGERRQTMDY